MGDVPTLAFVSSAARDKWGGAGMVFYGGLLAGRGDALALAQCACRPAEDFHHERERNKDAVRD